MGLSLGHTARVLQTGYGWSSAGRPFTRHWRGWPARPNRPYQGLLRTARQSIVNWVDETGWRVGGQSQWLWVAESERVTVYRILPGRGSEQLKQILGADYDGWLVHDGLRCYSRLDKACHQTCLTHLIRRCKEMGERATRAAAQFPGQVKTLLQQALLLSDRFELQEVTLMVCQWRPDGLEAAMDRLLDRDYRTGEQRRLAKHLRSSENTCSHFCTFRVWKEHCRAERPSVRR